jgi:hypothetical protein
MEREVEIFGTIHVYGNANQVQRNIDILTSLRRQVCMPVRYNPHDPRGVRYINDDNTTLAYESPMLSWLCRKITGKPLITPIRFVSSQMEIGPDNMAEWKPETKKILLTEIDTILEKLSQTLKEVA